MCRTDLLAAIRPRYPIGESDMTSAKLSLTLQPSFDAGRAQQRTRFDLSEQEQSEFAAMQSARSHPFGLPQGVRVLEAVQREDPLAVGRQVLCDAGPGDEEDAAGAVGPLQRA